MYLATRKKKLLRRAGVTVLVLMAIYAAVGSAFSHYYKGLIMARLPSLAAKATDSLYDITVQDIRINIFTRVVTVTGLRMSANLDVLQRRRAEGRPPNVVLDVTVPEAEVAGVHWNDLKQERELTCRSVHFQDPEIRIQIMPWWRQAAKRARTNAPTVSRVFANHISIDEPHFDIRYSYGEDGFTVQTDGGHISAGDWDYHPRKAFDTSRFFAAKWVDARLDNISYQYPGALYRYALGSVQFKSKENLLRFQNMHIKPALPYAELYERIGHRQTIYDCTLPSVRLQGLQWKRLIDAEHVLVADRLVLDTPQLSMFLSKRPPPNPKPLPGYFPIQWLQRVDFPINIGLISIRDGTVEYGESNARTGRAGSLLFDYLRGNLVNVTNMPGVIARDSECRLFMSGKFAYRADVAVAVRFSLKSTKGAFSFGGKLRGLDAGGIRQAVNAMAFAELKSLQVPDVTVSMAGNEDSLWGKANIQYSRLKVKLQKWNDVDSEVHNRVLMNFLANKILLYQANPMPGEQVRLASIGLGRGTTHSFFQFVWKGIAEACIQTAIREEGAYDIAQRRKAAKGKPKRRFFKGLFPKRR